MFQCLKIARSAKKKPNELTLKINMNSCTGCRLVGYINSDQIYLCNNYIGVINSHSDCARFLYDFQFYDATSIDKKTFSSKIFSWWEKPFEIKNFEIIEHSQATQSYYFFRLTMKNCDIIVTHDHFYTNPMIFCEKDNIFTNIFVQPWATDYLEYFLKKYQLPARTVCDQFFQEAVHLTCASDRMVLYDQLEEKGKIHMKTQILSDLHLDQYLDQGESFINSLKPNGIDILILAGDITSGNLIPKTIERFSKKYPNAIILYILGNHEYYESNANNIYQLMLYCQKTYSNFHWLENSGFEIKGQKFFGTSLWYPGLPQTRLNCMKWSDFHAIQEPPEWFWNAAETASKQLQSIKQDDIVITHMLPSEQSISKQFKGSWTNIFFLHDQEKLIQERKPKMWVHAHTHSSFNYKLFDTQIICNPRGNRMCNIYDTGKYLQLHENKQFNKNLVIGL